MENLWGKKSADRLVSYDFDTLPVTLYCQPKDKRKARETFGHWYEPRRADRSREEVADVAAGLGRCWEHCWTVWAPAEGNKIGSGRNKTKKNDVWSPLSSLLLLLNSHRRGFMHVFHIWPDIGKGAKAT